MEEKTAMIQKEGFQQPWLENWLKSNQNDSSESQISLLIAPEQEV